MAAGSSAYPALSANTIVLYGRWWNNITRLGQAAQITAVPRLAANQAATTTGRNERTPNLRSSVDEADIKTEPWRCRPLRDGALWAMPLLPTNDTQFGAYGGWDITPGDEPTVLVELLENSPEIVLDQEMLDALAVAYGETGATPLDLEVGDRIQAMWIGHAAVLTTPAPTPTTGFLSAEATTALVASYTWRHRGPWSAATAYDRRDVVSSAGSSWVADAPSTGVTPGSDASWRLVASKGDKGDKGNTGDKGADSTAKGDKGDKGNTGDPGPANTLGIDTVSTGAAGSNADASVVGTSPNQKLRLVIPRGDKGDKGDKGLQGDPGTNGTNGAAGAKGDPGSLPEATQTPRTAALGTPSNLLNLTNRYALTAAATQALPAVTEGAVIALAVTVSSTASLTLQAAGTDVFGDGTNQTMALAPGDFYFMRGQVPSSGPARWRRLTGPVYSEQDAHNDLRYAPRVPGVTPLTIASGSTTPDASNGKGHHRGSTAANLAIVKATGSVDTQRLVYEITNTATAAITVTLAADYDLGGSGYTSRAFQVAAGKVALFVIYNLGGTLRLLSVDSGG